MTTKNSLRIHFIEGSLVLLLLCGLTACKAEVDNPPAVVEPQVTQSDQPVQSATESNQLEPANEGSEPVDVEAAWQSSPHAASFVTDAAGQNNTCARCHAPVNWMPSMDDLPESCYSCKFELEDPPSYIPETEWTNISCNVCHKVDKKDNIQPEYAWLEIAPLGEYANVASTTELCLKCHNPEGIPGHVAVEVGGAHAGYECTACHSAHDTTASCGADGCHGDVVEPAEPIAGHDADHQAVSCEACHDANNMEIGLDEESGLWTTFAAETTGASDGRFAFTSHNVILEAQCDRCHFVDNPWGLSNQVAEP